MKKILNNFFVRRGTDILLSPLTLLSTLWFKYVRTGSSRKMPVSEAIFMKVGVLPINDHYYQPLINPSKHLSTPLDKARVLPGINWNIEQQLSLLKEFNYIDELNRIPKEKKDSAQFEYYYNNTSFCPGDAEYFYNIIRHFKPRRIIEVGCGYSTMLAMRAEQKNEEEGFKCEHTCIEPYEMPWLEQLKVKVLRSKIEDVEKSLFESLEKNDILFIDSSHIIRPQGDVLFEFLEILPTIKSGVIIHVHDIFSPRDYPREWIYENHCMWNEQYLLEAFLSFNSQFSIIGALNFLNQQFHKEFISACPNSGRAADDDPGSFWMVRV